MFPGSPARLRPGVALHAILPLAVPGRVLGVWLRGALRPAAVRCRSPGGPRFLLAAEDLGYLLTRCGDVVVRDGRRIAPVPAPVLLGWRVLEIVLAAPYLPPPAQLRALFPSMQVREGILSLPLGCRSAEEALAQCSAAQLPVAATRVTYRARDR